MKSTTGPVASRPRGAIAKRFTREQLRARPAAELVELARPGDGTRYRRVTLVLDRDGGLTLGAHEMGAGPEDAWGMDDEELTLSIPPTHVGRLALVLAAGMLEDGKDAVRRLAELCEAYDIPHRKASWT